jgi:hypothetical protein
VPDWLLAVLAALTCYRLTRLVVRDDFPPARAVRDAVRRYAIRRHAEWLDDLVTCHWCASGWVAIGLVLLVTYARPVAEPVCLAGGIWAAGALVAEHEDGKP